MTVADGIENEAPHVVEAAMYQSLPRNALQRLRSLRRGGQPVDYEQLPDETTGHTHHHYPLASHEEQPPETATTAAPRSIVHRLSLRRTAYEHLPDSIDRKWNSVQCPSCDAPDNPPSLLHRLDSLRKAISAYEQVRDDEGITTSYPFLEKPASTTASQSTPSTAPYRYDTFSPVRRETSSKSSRTRAILITIHLSMSAFLTATTTGLLTTSIPRMAVELSIRPQESYWPMSVYGLTSGACLLLFGALADVLGSKRIYLSGLGLMAPLVLGCGLVKTGNELVGLRALQGITNAMCLPSTMGLLTRSIGPGRGRNMAVACTGLAQPLGFSVGLVFGGVFIDTVGWRVGWYMTAGMLLALVPMGLWLFPRDEIQGPLPERYQGLVYALKTRVDWVGTAIACLGLSMLALGLLQISAQSGSAGGEGATSGSSSTGSPDKSPMVIIPLVLSGILAPFFAWWMNLSVKRGWPALIPNAVWKQLPFTGICVIVLLSYAVLQTMDLFSPLYFQNVQGLDPMQSSLQLVPSMVVGVMCNILTGLFVDKIRPLYLILVSSVLCAGSPLLMAVIKPEWPYWYAAFPAQMLQPISCDVLFCVGLIVISEMFPDDTQALAGAVFNTASQMGSAVGLTVIGVIADRVTHASKHDDKSSPQALGEGYGAAFSASFAFMLSTCLVALLTMRGVGRVGLEKS